MKLTQKQAPHGCTSADRHKLSRRSFLKGGALMLGASTLTIGAPQLIGCSTEPNENGPAPLNEVGASAVEATATESALPDGYQVVNADVLIIGGGNLGVNIALSALSEGREVTMLDKGVWRHSGVSGMSWDYFAGRYFTPAISYLGIENGKALTNALSFTKERDRYVYQVNHGQTLPDRDEKGQYLPLINENRTQGQFCRRHMDNLRTANGFGIDEQFMVTSLLIQDGKCLGAMGIHLPTGAFRVYRANATAIATGGCCWFYGWMTVGSYSINNPDNTADAEMAAFRQGLAIANSEFACYDLMSINPPGLACAFGGGIGADAQEYQFVFDNAGERLFSDDDENVSDRNYFNQLLAKAIAIDGRGTESNGVFLNVGDHGLRYGNARNVDLLERFGVGVRTDQIQIAPEMFEHGGSPIVDENMMTEVEGLFCGRNFPGGADVAGNYYYGLYTGHKIAEYAASQESKADGPSVNWEDVNVERARLEAIRTHRADDGVRPLQVRQMIQEAGFTGMGVYRTTELMEKSLAELRRIREEELPRMTVADSSLVFNTEWKHAIENYNLLDLAEMSVQASLNREETRGSYMRAEFPEKDNVNWNCVQVCRLQDDQMVFEKVSFEPLDASVLEQ